VENARAARSFSWRGVGTEPPSQEGRTLGNPPRRSDHHLVTYLPRQGGGGGGNRRRGGVMGGKVQVLRVGGGVRVR